MILKPLMPLNSPIDGRIYVASPTPTFGTDYHRRMLCYVRACLPGADLVLPSDVFESTEDWLRQWPNVLASLTGLVFFAEPDGTLGMGVCKEVQDAEAAGLPVWHLDGSRQLHTMGTESLVPFQPQTPRWFARVEVCDG